MTARQLALKVLLRCEKSGGYSPIVLDTALSRSELDVKDRALATALVTAVISHRITLDYIIGRLSSIPEERSRLKRKISFVSGFANLDILTASPHTRR